MSRVLANPGVCLCGQSTSEADATGTRAAHAACTAAVMATVEREAFPYEDASGVAAWLAGQRTAAGWET